MTYKAWLKRYQKGPEWPEKVSIVSVVWDDASYAQDVEDSGLARAVTLGIVVEATPSYVKTASEFFVDKEVRDVTTIPAGMIIQVYSLGSCPIPDEPVPTRTPKRK